MVRATGKKRKAEEESRADEAVAAAVAAVEGGLADEPQDEEPQKKAPPTSRAAVARAKMTGVTEADIATSTDDNWNRMMYQLLFYRAVKGDTHIGAKDKNFPELFSWAQEQRKQYKIFQTAPEKSALSEVQIQILESLQFHWHTRGEEHWRIHYEKLQAYNARHGHVLVPRVNPEDPKLGDWVCEQRHQYKLMTRNETTTMTPERKKALDDLGFAWQIRQRPEWDARYQQLVNYQKEHGDTLVPQFYKQDKGLGKWVAKQREQYKLLKDGKHSFLTPDRLERLNAINFCWSIKGKVAREGKDASFYYHPPVAAGMAPGVAAAPEAPIPGQYKAAPPASELV